MVIGKPAAMEAALLIQIWEGISEDIRFQLRSEGSLGWWRGKSVPGRGCAMALW